MIVVTLTLFIRISQVHMSNLESHRAHDRRTQRCMALMAVTVVAAPTTASRETAESVFSDDRK